MLKHHFGAETRYFQGLLDQNDWGKALVPEKWYFRVTETSGEWTFLFRLFFCISFLILRRCGSGKERVAVAANLNPPPKLQSLTDHLPIRAHIIRAHIRLFTKYCHSSSNPKSQIWPHSFLSKFISFKIADKIQHMIPFFDGVRKSC